MEASLRAPTERPARPDLKAEPDHLRRYSMALDFSVAQEAATSSADKRGDAILATVDSCNANAAALNKRLAPKHWWSR